MGAGDLSHLIAHAYTRALLRSSWFDTF